MSGTYTFKLAKTIVVQVEARSSKDAQTKLAEKLKEKEWFMAFALADTTQELIPKRFEALKK